MKYFSFRTKVVFFLSTLVVTVAAVSLTDLQSDEQSQRTIKVFGSYSGDALTLPDQLVCVISQLWKTEFVGQGNVHVKVNEKNALVQATVTKKSRQ